ncbi:response regulator [Mangrovivirga sp. M17]|uniref:histidine kinase n=1 Tax=Mangrovivirga halotolerans TaxID=2993936 RepID=A0ABT3RPB3_9BACT|nr:response regulator [Mangrovivirga halotolerans]MCX2743199.1 response regulator [Mangrovivirga halotolerans]
MNNYKILIIEDAQIIALHLKTLLSNVENYEIKTASNSIEAFDIFESFKPDLVIADIMLDDGDDGVETVRELQSKYHLAVIYLTALTDRGTVERAKTTHPYGYLMKPFQESQVLTTVEMALNKYSLELKLKNSERQFHAAFSAISDAMMVLGLDNDIIFSNRSAGTFRCSNGEDDNLFNFIQLEDESEKLLKNKLKIAKRNTQTLPLELLEVNTSGGKKCFIGEGMISPITNTKNEVINIVISFRDITKKIEDKKKKEEIERKRLTYVIEGQEMEKHRIARDIHDGLGQMLNAIKLNLKYILEGEDKKKSIETLNSLIEEAIQETSRISNNILPSKVKDFDLASLLNGLVNSRIESLNMHFDATEVDNDKITIHQKINIYRIVQEAISNTIKHSEAENFYVQMHENNDHITITIEDDGKGFDLKKLDDKLLSGHNGLQNMRDRVNIMKGSIEIESQAGKGMNILFSIPYEE